MNIWEFFFLQPITNILLFFYTLFSGIGIPGALGWAIICLTVLIRLLLYPMTKSQLQNMHKMQALAPHLKKIKEKHGHDARRHQEEQLKLYRAHGVNPLAGCLPMVVQIPFFIALYNRLQFFLGGIDSSAVVSEMNRLVYAPFLKLTGPMDPTFFGVSLAMKPSAWSETGVWLLLVPILTGGLQLIQSKLMGTQSQEPRKREEKSGGKKESMEETMQSMQKQMMYFFPVMIGAFSYQFPLGLSLYWNTFTLFGIMQQRQVQRDAAKNRIA